MSDRELGPEDLNQGERELVWFMWKESKNETSTGEFRRWYHKQYEIKLADEDAKEWVTGKLSQCLGLHARGRIKVRMGCKDRFEALGDAVDDFRSASRSVKPPAAPVLAQAKPRLELLRWQRAALKEWNVKKRRGIVEAVTGTGKSYLGIGALLESLGDTGQLRPVVVVPTIALLAQWHSKLSEYMASEAIGRIGGGYQDAFNNPRIRVIIGVINSLVRARGNRLNQLLQNCLRGNATSMLIADECHRYCDAPEFGRLLEFPFGMTLGLSATVGDYEVPGLGRVVFEYTFLEAYRDGLVPHFEMVNVAVDLTPEEAQQHHELSEKISDEFKRVLDVYPECENLDGDRLWNRMRAIMGRMGSGDAPSIERFFVLCFRRAAIAYTSAGKLDIADQLARLLINVGRRKCLVFFERIQSVDHAGEELATSMADGVHERLAAGGRIPVFMYHSQMDDGERERVLALFRMAGPSALLACRSLDEGLDVPDVDGAILVASTQSLRQRIQRIGRVLRVSEGGKDPIVITLRVRGTNDYSITAEDKRVFDGVATIHSVDADRAVEVVEKLIRQ